MRVNPTHGDREVALEKLKAAGVEAAPAGGGWPLETPELLVLSGRNLGVPWTKFPGIDPEMNGAAGNNANWSPPPIRYFIAKVNVAF